MSQRYVYADKVSAGRDVPTRRWGLFADEITEAQARARYELDPPDGTEWFGVVLVPDGEERPTSFLEVAPQLWE